ncbi:MAG: hypothetical protein ACHRXM_35230 [Isosphaerales bacterium]
MRNRRRGSLRLHLDELDDRCLLSGFWPVQPSGLTPSQITGAYGLSAIKFTSSTGTTVTGDGTGETIALIETYHDPNIQSDLATFDAKFNLPNPTLTVVNQAGGQTDSGWALEESLDVEMAHSIAPGASILVVEAAPSYSATQELQDLLNAVNTARNTAGVVAVSMSWGFNEMSSESSYDSYFTTPAGHTGITFIASSGDNGVVEYPSASPNVLSVGGTSLIVTSSGTYGSETAWIDSGGGYSRFEPEPSYQQSVQTTGTRSVPDVAFNADPNTGAAVYATDPGTGRGAWQVVGGTSVGSPSWAGLVAIVDQGRALAGKGALDGPAQTLPALYAAPSSNFNTVTPSSASSQFGGGFDRFGAGGFSYSFWGFGFGSSLGSTTSGATANTSTGLGSPNGNSLVSNLVASSLTTTLTTSGTSSGQSGSGTTPATPTQPPKPVGGGSKHHGKHGHTTQQPHKKAVAVHKRALVKHGHSAAKHLSVAGVS